MLAFQLTRFFILEYPVPFANVPADKQDKMHRCVTKVKDSGKSEESAVAICYASIVEGQAAPDDMKDIMAEFILDLSAFDMLTDLQEQNVKPGKPFDGMRAGTFIDMRGTPVTFGAAELAEYVRNTNAAIEATKTPSGDIVGLPIDSRNHDKGDAAGWIIKAELVGDVIQFTPKWTTLGIDLIGASLQRFFSPTVDVTNKTVTGGSLTNWPATRTKGKTLLRPIELAEGDPNPMEETINKIVQMLGMIWEKIAPKAEPEEPENPEAEPAPMSQAPNLAAELAQAQAQIAELQAQFERKNNVMEFARRVTAGTPAMPRGLNIPADQLAEVLLSMPTEQASKVQTMLENLVVVDFSERGHNGKIDAKQTLPDVYRPYMAQWLAAGKTPESFFSVNPEIGKAADFNLSEFQKEI